MNKNSNAIATAAIILIVISAICISWGLTCGLIKLITWCFGCEFSWKFATGIYLIVFFIGGIFKK